VTQTSTEPTRQRGNRRTAARGRGFVGVLVCALVALAAAVGIAVPLLSAPAGSAGSGLTKPVRYLGAYEPGAPGSYSGIDHLAKAIGRQPNIVVYYGPWLGKFAADFATSAANRGAVTLVQLGTDHASLASIAKGRYDSYWRSYADEVKAFGGQVILSLDHEMNGDWEVWGYRHASPEAFIAAWQHVVTIFREQGVNNVTWLWTVNIIDPGGSETADPARWWPGNSYVDWVGIDGYYYGRSATFASLFGPTIADVRGLTHDPILIAETGASLSAGQPAKIVDLFNGVRLFGLLGFVWFDQNGVYKDIQTWRINSRAAYEALRQETRAYMKPPP
jgi:mannan endo-1,4-beta-mannosidase